MRRNESAPTHCHTKFGLVLIVAQRLLWSVFFVTLAACGGGGSAGNDSNAVTANSNGLATAPAWSLLAGDISQTGAVDDVGAAARFSLPQGIAADGMGNIYVADTINHTIRKITAAGSVSTIAGAAGILGSADGSGGTARFNYPGAVAADSSGNIYVADSYNHTIRKIAANGFVSTFAGTAGSSGGTDGAGGVARFLKPFGLATDSIGNVYVADSYNHTVRKITAAGAVSTLAGAAGSMGSADGKGSAARFFYPASVATDTSGNVYVADSNNATIRKITPDGTVSTLAGTAGIYGNTDGYAQAASFRDPVGIAVDGVGNVYVADKHNQTIRKVTPTGMTTTVGGHVGIPGFAIGGLPGFLDSPLSLAIYGTTLYTLSVGAVVMLSNFP